MSVTGLVRVASTSPLAWSETTVPLYHVRTKYANFKQAHKDYCMYFGGPAGLIHCACCACVLECVHVACANVVSACCEGMSCVHITCVHTYTCRVCMHVVCVYTRERRPGNTNPGRKSDSDVNIVCMQRMPQRRLLRLDI